MDPRDDDANRSGSRDENHNAIHDANHDASRGDASRDDDGDRHHHQTDGIHQPVLWRTEPQWPRGCKEVSGSVRKWVNPRDTARMISLRFCIPFLCGMLLL